MALILADRVRELTTTTGTGSVTLIGSPDGFETFAASIGDGNTTYYTIAEKTGDNWEVGVGTYRSAGNLLERTTVLSSSDGGNKVAFAAGDKDVFVTLPAEKAVSSDSLAAVATTGAYSDLTGKPTLGSISSQNADSVAITGGAIDGTTIGSTTPAAATFTTLIGGKDQANYGQLTGGATTKAVEFKTLGSDTNIACAIRSKGTGAIDLAAGSSGLNISNGGTVTAITRTATGASYTSTPTVTISSPTTAGGVQATATAQMFASGGTVAAGGSGYAVNDTVSITGYGSTIALTVTSVSAGAITGYTANSGGLTSLPTSPVAQSSTSGTGTGATFNLTYGVTTSFTITNAGSGYVEQPTVTFSGGGGSGAAAYATVGGGTQIKSLGSTLDFYTPNAGIGLRVEDSGGTGTNYWRIRAGGGQLLATAAAVISSTGNNNVSFYTNGITQEQLRVAHTASAVNYVQVTGSQTGQLTLVSAVGSDASVGMELRTKGTPTGPGFRVSNNSGANVCFAVQTSVSNPANYLTAIPAATGATPSYSVGGSDTNIDLALTPKGTGLVRFGTYTAGAPTATGYISIKAANGTTYKVLVGT